MADENDTNAPTANEQRTSQRDEPKFTQAQLDAIVQDRVARAKPSDYDDVKAKAAKFDEQQQADQSELDRAKGDLTKAQQELEDTKRANLRLKVSLEKGLTGPKAIIADVLQGKDEAEMGAHADQLLALMKTDDAGGSGGTDGQGQKGQGQGQQDDVDLHQGARGSTQSDADRAREAQWLKDGFGIDSEPAAKT